MQRTKLKDRILPIYSKGEEIFNMTSHIVGAVLGIVATTLCVVFAAIHGNGYGVVSGAIYGFTMILLYTMSSIYHGLSPKRYSKKVFQVLDHCSIFLLIAGSYSPFALCSFREYNTALRMDNIWSNLGNGNIRNSIKFNRYKKIQSVFYDLLFRNGLVHIIYSKFIASIIGKYRISIISSRRSGIFCRSNFVWTWKKT